jgi:hypothetical protein
LEEGHLHVEQLALHLLPLSALLLPAPVDLGLAVEVEGEAVGEVALEQFAFLFDVETAQTGLTAGR